MTIYIVHCPTNKCQTPAKSANYQKVCRNDVFNLDTEALITRLCLEPKKEDTVKNVQNGKIKNKVRIKIVKLS
jgi:hypothetical protein